MTFDEVMPLLPSGAGQSRGSITSTGRTSHQMAPALTRELSTTWLWFGVGTKIGAVGGLGAFPSAPSSTDKSTDDACIVHVPGTGLFGSGHWVATAGVVFQASGTKPNSEISALPSAVPHSSVGLPPFGHCMASSG